MKIFGITSTIVAGGLVDPIDAGHIGHSDLQEIAVPKRLRTANNALRIPEPILLDGGGIAGLGKASANLAATLTDVRVSSSRSLLSDAIIYRHWDEEIPSPDVFPWQFGGEEIPATSNDLLEPLRPSHTEGKTYRKDAESPAQANIFEGDATQRDPYAFPRKAYEAKRPEGLVRQSLSIWDLLYPILLPPVLLDFEAQMDLPREPWPHQRTGVDFLISHESALLGDEMGTGKTATTVLSIRLLFRQGKIRRALVVCPLVTLRSWDRHFFEWAPEISVTVVRGSPDQRLVDWGSPAHVYITTYDSLIVDLLSENACVSHDQTVEFDLVALDEAQRIKNPRAKRSRAVKRFSPTYRWAITGTPIETKLDDLVAIFSFVKPGYMALEGITELRARELLDPHFRRIEKAAVLKDLPAKIREEEWLALDAEQGEAYDAALLAGRRKLEELGEKVTRVHIFTVIRLLKQICNFAPGKSGSPKSRYLVKKINEIAEEGHKVVVFSQYLGEGLEKLAPLLKNHGVVKFQGGMSENEREQAINKFRNDDSCKVFLGSLKAAGTGLDGLQYAASYLVLFDHWWNPAVMWQAEDRLHRSGQIAPVNVYSLWMSNTIEQRIYDKLEEHGLLAEKIVGPLSKEEMGSLISTEEWLEMLDVSWGERSKLGERKPATSISGEALVLEKLQTIDPIRFEEVVRQLFLKLNFSGVKTTQRSHDGGVDLLMIRNTVGGPEHWVAQCKRVKTVGVEVARELLGVIENERSITKGFIVTSGQVSPQCKTFCESNGRLACLSGPEVAKHIVQFGLTDTLQGADSEGH